VSITGVAEPALNAHAETVLVEHLGLPTSGEMVDVWVVPETAHWTFSDWPMIVLGLLIALGGWLIIRAREFRDAPHREIGPVQTSSA